MTLENVLRIGRLKEHPADVAEIMQLLAAALRNVADYLGEAVDSTSPEWRLKSAQA